MRTTNILELMLLEIDFPIQEIPGRPIRTNNFPKMLFFPKIVYLYFLIKIFITIK